MKRAGKPAGYIVMDNELATKKLRLFSEDEGINFQLTAPYEPSQNHTAERTLGLVKVIAPQTCVNDHVCSDSGATEWWLPNSNGIGAQRLQITMGKRPLSCGMAGSRT